MITAATLPSESMWSCAVISSLQTQMCQLQTMLPLMSFTAITALPSERPVEKVT